MTAQIPVDELLVAEIGDVSKPFGLDSARSIREALLSWLKLHEGRCFEPEWTTALEKHADDSSRAEERIGAQAW